MSLESKEQYLTDVNGNRIAVVIDINVYQKLLDELDEYYCIKGYEQAVTETEPEIRSGDYLTLEQYLANR
ncbi:hypothetical protein [Crocosphaera sp. XPORK-15E]|uniref:hypothetical protein n=1 Tax=Crocosphaera sp. XPORK-15E TaxID=3110247 RepID=UPI002B20EC7A|nr:hypothetical protein [Crocosphaera sp. XPORK-15E]MEA5533812.1 hypothetical protein [Crocosphaera sp. XPORK-15E]